MNKKLLALTLLLPFAFTACDKTDTTSYLSKKEALLLLESIKTYREEHVDDFKIYDSFSFEAIADVNIEGLHDRTFESVSFLHEVETIYGDASQGIYEKIQNGGLYLSEKIRAQTYKEEYCFTSEDNKHSYYSIYENDLVDNEETKTYTEYDLSTEEEAYNKCVNNKIADEIKEIVYTDDMDLITSLVVGDFSPLDFVNEEKPIFYTSKITSNGKGSISIDINGFARRALNDYEVAQNSSFKIHHVIENYISTEVEYSIITNGSFLTKEDDRNILSTSNIVFAYKTTYAEGCKVLNRPDLSDYTKTNH